MFSTGVQVSRNAPEHRSGACKIIGFHSRIVHSWVQ